MAGKLKVALVVLRNGCSNRRATCSEELKMVTMRASVPSSSPHVYGSSPYSLSHILDQHHNQCVPGSPSLSPFFRHAALPQTMLTRNSSPGTAQVPESAVTETISNSAGYSNGSRVYTGSPLLRQILRGEQKC